MGDELSIEIERPERPRQAGDAIEGVVRVRTDRGDECRGVVLRQFWRTHGRGNTDRGVVAELQLHDGPLPSDQERRFAFELEAPEGPYTYHGRTLNVDHYLEAVLDVARADDPSAEVDFAVVPGAHVPAPSASYQARASGPVYAGRSGCSGLLGLLFIVVGVSSLPVGLVFVAVGLFVLVPSIRTALAGRRLGSIVPSMHPEVVTPGEEVEIRVKIRPDRYVTVNRVQATLRGLEVCISGSGNEQKTHREELHSEEIILYGPATVPAGETAVFRGSAWIPDLDAYTFDSPSNRVVWQADVHVDIPMWPDWSGSTVFLVWPGSTTEARRPAGQASLPKGEVPRDRPSEPDTTPSPVYPVEPDSAASPTEPVEPATTPPPTDPPEPDVSSTPVHRRSEPEIARRIRAIVAAPRFGGARPRSRRELEGGEYTFTLVVETNRRSFGVPLTHRNGRTLEGTIEGTELSVEVRFPADRNPETEGLKTGDRIEVRSVAVEWESLEGRAVVDA